MKVKSLVPSLPEKSCNNCQYYYGRPPFMSFYYCCVSGKDDLQMIDVGIGFNSPEWKICDSWQARSEDYKEPLWMVG